MNTPTHPTVAEQSAHVRTEAERLQRIERRWAWFAAVVVVLFFAGMVS